MTAVPRLEKTESAVVQPLETAIAAPLRNRCERYLPALAALTLAAALHLPLVRMFVRPSLDDDQPSRRPPFCSQACVMADRLGGGVDPVPHLADRLTEPADLARSPFYRYRFTLE